MHQAPSFRLTGYWPIADVNVLALTSPLTPFVKPHLHMCGLCLCTRRSVQAMTLTIGADREQTGGRLVALVQQAGCT